MSGVSNEDRNQDETRPTGISAVSPWFPRGTGVHGYHDPPRREHAPRHHPAVRDAGQGGRRGLQTPHRHARRQPPRRLDHRDHARPDPAQGMEGAGVVQKNPHEDEKRGERSPPRPLTPHTQPGPGHATVHGRPRGVCRYNRH